MGGAANIKYDALTSCRADHAHGAAFKFQFRDRRVPVKSSERFCSMQIQTVEDVRASRILGEQKKEREKEIKEEKEITNVEQRAREKRSKSESAVGGDAEGDLKNGVVKHSTHIVSHLSTLLSRVFPTTHTHTYSPTSFQPFPPSRASS